MRRLGIALLLGLVGSAAGCKASVNANVNAQLSDEQGEANSDDSGQISDGTGEGDGFLDQGMADPALLGARHDLMLGGDNPQATCQCLAVAVGPPHSPAFFWQAIAPTTDPNSQLVVAFTSDGVSCAAPPPDSLGASYWGYKHDGDNVIVVVENASPGRPQTTGAIIPRPVGAGQIFIEPLNKSVPYGRALDGSARCSVPVTTNTQPAVPPPPTPSAPPG